MGWFTEAVICQCELCLIFCLVRWGALWGKWGEFQCHLQANRLNYQLKIFLLCTFDVEPNDALSVCCGKVDLFRLEECMWGGRGGLETLQSRHPSLYYDLRGWREMEGVDGIFLEKVLLAGESNH